MVYNLDVMTTVNLGLSILILIVGCRGYIKYKDKTPFHVGVAFGLFAVSHLITLLGMERALESTMVLIRIFGYLIVLFTLYQIESNR